MIFDVNERRLRTSKRGKGSRTRLDVAISKFSYFYTSELLSLQLQVRETQLVVAFCAFFLKSSSAITGIIYLFR